MGMILGHNGLFAPQSYWDATPEEIEEYTGGCGPGKLGDYFVPDTLYGESIFLACQIHDWCYYVNEKYWGDLYFLMNMTILITRETDALDVVRLRRVMTYFEAVYYCGQAN